MRRASAQAAVAISVAVLLAFAVGSAATAAGRPRARITAGPAKTVRTGQRKARVRFHFTTRPRAAGAAFECSIDGRPYRGCRSPKTYRLREGRHAFRLRAVAGGVTGPPTSVSFKVERR